MITRRERMRSIFFIFKLIIEKNGNFCLLNHMIINRNLGE